MELAGALPAPHHLGFHLELMISEIIEEQLLVLLLGPGPHSQLVTGGGVWQQMGVGLRGLQYGD